VVALARAAAAAARSYSAFFPGVQLPSPETGAVVVQLTS
jgi:hypothetical protein